MSRPSIVVIGAGLAGSLLCNELADRADVTLLEIGEKDRIHYPPIRFDRKPLGHINTFCFGGGGTTNLWHNGLIPIDRRDVADAEFRDVLAKSQPYIDEAARRLFFAGEYSRAYAESVAEATAIGRSAGLVGDGMDSLLYPKRFRPLTTDPRVDAHYSVDRIAFRCSGTRIVGIDYTTRGLQSSLEVDDVIVAAGAMGTPKILRDIMAATGRQCGIPGDGFIDHPLGFVGKVRFRTDVADAIDRLSMTDRGDYVVRSAVRLKSDCGHYTCCVFLRPALTMWNQLSIYKYESYLGATTGLTRVKNALSWKILHPDIVAEVVARLFGTSLPSRTYNVLFVAEQRRSDNCVRYDGESLRVAWSISTEELAAYRSMLTRFRDALAGISDQVNIKTDLSDDWLWSGAHHSGTTKMGATPADSIDADLKLRCCENAYVCDGSVIQEHSYANTGLTIAALALRLARERFAT